MRPFDRLWLDKEDKRYVPLLLWRDDEGQRVAARLLRWYAAPGAGPILVMAHKSPDCPWPKIEAESGYNLIRSGHDGIVIVKGSHFALAAAAFKGCYEPLARRKPDRRQYFPAPTTTGSETLAKVVLSLLGLPLPWPSYQVQCDLSGERITGYDLSLATLGEE